MKVKCGLASLQLPVYLIGLIETLIWRIQLVRETTTGSGSVLPSSATGGATRGRAPGRRRRERGRGRGEEGEGEEGTLRVSLTVGGARVGRFLCVQE